MNASDMKASSSRALADLVPGGSHTYAKGDDQYPTNAPRQIVRGSGCRVWGSDGREFIEYGMGLRSVSLGHAYPEVVEAAHAEMLKGANFTRPAAIEQACAECVLSVLEGPEMIKFAKNGSDVTTAAIKLARAATGRDLVAICADHPFFSVDDWFIGTTPVDAGIPGPVKALTVGFNYDDVESLKALFNKHPGQIACVIMEPEKTAPPSDGFLAGVQQLCKQNGALLIFDEIITGFRHYLGSAFSEYGVAPDLSTYGKAMGNGFAVSALAGRREIMDLGGLQHDAPRVFLLSTTFGAETHALAAAMATIRVYEREDVVGHLHRQGNLLAAGVTDLAQEFGLVDQIGVAGRPSNLVFFTRDEEGSPSQPFRTLFMQELIKHGVLAPSFVVSYSHTSEDIERTLDAVRCAMEVYRNALDSDVQQFLEGPSVKPVYRRFN